MRRFFYLRLPKCESVSHCFSSHLSLTISRYCSNKDLQFSPLHLKKTVANEQPGFAKTSGLLRPSQISGGHKNFMEFFSIDWNPPKLSKFKTQPTLRQSPSGIRIANHTLSITLLTKATLRHRVGCGWLVDLVGTFFINSFKTCEHDDKHREMRLFNTIDPFGLD